MKELALTGQKGEVFILGAGFSKAVSEAMPLTEDLKEPLLGRFPSSITNDDILPETDDFEAWLTYFSHEHPWMTESDNRRNFARFLDLSRGIRDVVREAEGKKERRGSDWLWKLTKYWRDNRSVVISFNYDTLIERHNGTSLEHYGSRLAMIYPLTVVNADVRRGAVVATDDRLFYLLKLHGSVNWWYSGRTLSSGGVIYYTHPEIENPDLVADMVPLIIPPALDKSSYFQHETVRAMWAQARAALGKTTRVFCLGYSLPEADLTVRFLMQRRHADSIEFWLGNTDKNSPAHFERLLPRSFRIKRNFVGADSISRLVEALTK